MMRALSYREKEEKRTWNTTKGESRMEREKRKKSEKRQKNRVRSFEWAVTYEYEVLFRLIYRCYIFEVITLFVGGISTVSIICGLRRESKISLDCLTDVK